VDFENNSEFLKRLLATFQVEARDHVKTISSGLIDLEREPNGPRQQEIIESIFRGAHSLKGAARAVNMTVVEALCKSLEDVFASLRNQKIEATTDLIDLLHEAVDKLELALSASPDETLRPEQFKFEELKVRLEDAAASKQSTLPRARREDQGKTLESNEAPAPEPVGSEAEILLPDSSRLPHAAARDTIRVPRNKLNPILLQAEELMSAKLSSRQRVRELEEIDSTLASWMAVLGQNRQEFQKLRYSLERSDESGAADRPQLAGLAELLEWNELQVRQLKSKVAAAKRSAAFESHAIGLNVDQLLEDTKEIMMTSLSSFLESFPRMVRDLSRDCGKEAQLVVRGGEVEMDKRILEELKDPFIHLLRNCIEHGIETPEVRKKKNKPARGTITLAISQADNRIEILLSDDGTGIDVEKVKARAVRMGNLSEQEAATVPDTEALPLVFVSGVSTNPIVTDISGRGLGLAIVRENVSKVGGSISLETVRDKGTSFRLVLPITAAAYRGIIVKVEDQLFVLPTTNVERALRIDRKTVKTVENQQTIEFDGQAVSLVRLGKALGLTQQSRSGDDDAQSRLPALLLSRDEKRVAFLVDEIVSEQEILIKSLGGQLPELSNIAGATLLSSGRLVPVLNVHALMMATASADSYFTEPHPEAEGESRKTRTRILVVEDSITARTLLKNILETSGYDVNTAVDGIDALTQLHSREFDVVLSDVDMPRMNGFNLTAKIRGDRKLNELPVILLTSLESREDKERGIEVGANAYIIKSDFDQSNLLEIVRRFA